jgi:hypothetical protein
VEVSANRLRIWRALSLMFLDTEIDEQAFRHIGKVVVECGYASDEVKLILWNEVYPVLEDNFRDPAGVWAGWPDDWLLQHLRMCERPLVEFSGDPAIKLEIEKCWAQVVRDLPAEYA